MPSRIRVDKGSENGDICAFIESVNGADRASFIAGPSVHNERVERLWRDVFTKVNDYYFVLFNHMTEKKMLDIADDVQLFCLQFTYLHRIDLHLQQWMAAWNNRSSGPLNGKSPDMVWMNDLQTKARGSQVSTAIRNAVVVPAAAIDAAKRELLIEADQGQYQKSRYRNPLNRENHRLLRQSVDAVRHSDVRGLDIYRDVHEFVLDKLRQQNQPASDVFTDTT